MKIDNSKISKRVIALTLFVGALPFLYCAPAHAEDDELPEEMQEQRMAVEESSTESGKSRWLDDYSKPVGFTYSAYATLQTAYLFRGNYAGGPNIQAAGTVGYGGLYGTMWWNVGVHDWQFNRFQPELDFMFGFARWGVDVSVLYVYNFNRSFFDITNYPDYGNTLELRARYTVSSKLPLSILWATRLAGADGYLNAAGDTVRAWSSWLELSYTHHFPYSISLYGAIGITPWRSRYTGFKRDFAVQLIEVRLRKEWTVSKHCGMMIQGSLTVNPSGLAADKSSAQWHPYSPSAQTVNANVGMGVFLR